MSRSPRLIFACAALAANCGGKLEGNPTGAGGVAAFDARSESRDAVRNDTAPDVSPAFEDGGDARVCARSERGRQCGSPLTGCPSQEECRPDGTGYYCACSDCRLELALGECSWTLLGPDLVGTDRTTGVLIPPPGGGIEASLPKRPSESACAALPGWYARTDDQHSHRAPLPGQLQRAPSAS